MQCESSSRGILLNAYEQVASLKARLSAEVPFSDQFLQSTSDDIKFYTRLPNKDVVKTVFDFVVPCTGSARCKLTPFQEFMVLMLKLTWSE